MTGSTFLKPTFELNKTESKNFVKASMIKSVMGLTKKAKTNDLFYAMQINLITNQRI